MHRLTGETVLPQGAGRTDAGVHALAQVASFALAAPLPPENLHRALNRVLPASIRVLAAEQVPPTFHARHSARGKLYEYRLFERRPPTETGIPVASRNVAADRICSPLLAPFVWDCRWPLELERMQAAAHLLRGTHDFSAMAASSRVPIDSAELPGPGPAQDGTAQAPPAGPPNPVKTIHSAHWEHRDEVLSFCIHGSGFLHHMVRNLVGTLVEIGRGSLRVEDLGRILASRDRSQAGPTAPAQGLYLVEVLYPSLPSSLPAEASDQHTEAGRLEFVR